VLVPSRARGRVPGRTLAPVGSAPAGDAVFPATHHSVLVEVQSDDPTRRDRGLTALAAAYWRPIYTYLRIHWRRGHEEACDLTQEVFASLVERDLVKRFDASRARFRTYLRVCVDGLVANSAKAATRQKRGGGVSLLSFDFEEVRDELERCLPVAESPETLFEREWARSVFGTAVSRVRERLIAAGKGGHWTLLERHDLDAGEERPSYAVLARELGIGVTDVTNRLAFARRALRQALLDVVRELTGSEDEFRQEVRVLLGVDPR
jgi:RNA polymerase sigma factor (sigma-70 family)